MAAFLYEFEWDPDKAGTNFSKHGVNFERAAEVFCDPLAISILTMSTAPPKSGGLPWERIRMVSMYLWFTRSSN